MSNAIDQRIVEMSFENHKFEKGISESQKSLKEFANTLEKTGTGKEFTGLENTIQATAKSFSALEQIGIGALRRIGEAALNAGTNLFKGLAIAPINQGFGEMELKMNSTQTIMASTGETLAVVNGYLKELNEYSDKTIYSFANMTQNIGKFTNAGVKLEMAVASIKGISNAAALAGANSEEASRAMYNFAQALSAGYVKLVDWKSIELANMATVEFKEQLLESAVAAGTVAKTADGMYEVLTSDMSGTKMDRTISATKNFNESLSFQWMTTDALTKTLSNYADETTDIGKRATKAATQVTTLTKLMETLKESVGSGWSQTFEVIFGDFNEARDLWSGMNDTIGATINAMSDLRNSFLMGGLSSGWKQFMQQGISDTTTFADTLAGVAGEAGVDIDEIIKRTGSMEKAVRENWVTGEMLTTTIGRMSDSLENLSIEELANVGHTEKTRAELLKLRDALLSGTISAEEFAKKMTNMSGRENIIQGLKNSVVALLTAIRPITKAFDQIFPPKTADNLYHITEVFKNFTEKLILSQETVDKIQRTFAGFFAVVDIGWQTVKLLSRGLLEIVGIFMPLNGSILDATASFGDLLVAINQTIKRSGVFEYGLLGIKIAAVLIRDVLTQLTGKFFEFIRVLWTTDKPLEYLASTMTNVFDGVLDTLQKIVTWISSKFVKALDGVQKFFNTKFKFSDSNALTTIFESIKDFLIFLLGDGSSGIVTLSDALNKIDFSRIATFVTGGVLLLFVNQLSHLTKVSSDLVATTNGFVGKFSKKLFGTVTKFKDLAFAVAVLATSLYVLSQVPWDKLKNGLIGMAGAMLIFVGAYAAIQGITVISTKKMGGLAAVKSSLDLVSLAGSLAIMAIAIEKISKIDEGNVWEAVAVVGAMMGIITAYQALTVAISLIPGSRAANVGMSVMASGLLGLIGIIILLDNIEPASIVQGMGKLMGAMVMLAGIQAMFSFTASLTGGNKVSINLLSISVGILAMIGVIKLLGILSPREITQGIGSVFLMGGVLAAIQLMFSVAGRISKGIKFRTNILAMQVGLISMIALVAILGTMDQEKIQNGIVNLAKMSGIIAGLEIMTALAARLGNGMKLQKILGSVTLTMLSFTILIGVLGIYKESTIDKGLKTILKMSGIIVALEVLTALIGNIKGSAKGVGTIIGIVSLVLTLTASLALLSMLDQEALRQAALTLSIVVVSIGAMTTGLGIMLKSFSIMSAGIGGVKGAFKNLLTGFVLLGAVLVGALAFIAVVRSSSAMLESISWDSLGKFAVGLGAVSILASNFTTLSKIPGFGSGMLGLLPGFVAMGVVVYATGELFKVIGSVLPTVDSLSWSSFGKFIIGLGVISLLATGMALLSGPFMALGVGFLPALGGVLTAIVGLGFIIGAFVGLSSAMEQLFGEDPSFLIKGMDLLVLVGEAMGRFVGSIVGGFSSELLTSFGEGLAGFANSIKGIDISAFDGLGALATAMLTLTSASLLDGLAKLVGFDANPGKVFGEQIKGLIEVFKKISPTDAKLTTVIFSILKPMTDNLKALADAAKDIPRSGGFMQDFLGERSPKVFGEQLKGFIAAFVGVSTTAAKHATDILAALEPMSKNLKTFARAASAIPPSGGFMGDFLGENDVDTFGFMLMKLVRTFSVLDVAADVVPATSVLAAMTPMMERLKIFAIAAGEIPNSGGMITWFIGDNDLAKFGDKIGGLTETFGTLNRQHIVDANNNLAAMSISLLPGLSKFITLFNQLQTGGNPQFTNKSAFKALAEEIEDFVKIIKDVDITVVAPALESLNQINEAFIVVGATIATSAIASLRNNKEPFQLAIIELLEAAVQNVEANQAVISETFMSLLDKALYDMQSYVGDFREVGYNLVRGLQNGIISGQNYATYAANKMTGAVITMSQNTLEVRSPSKVFERIGKWLPEGLAQGIQRNSKVAILASANLSSGVEDAMRTGMVRPLAAAGGGGASLATMFSEGIDSGLKDVKNAVLKTAKDLGIDTANMTKAGITETIANGDGAVTKVVNGLMDILTGKTDGKTGIEEIAKDLGIDSGAGFAEGVTDGLTSGAGGATGAASSMAKDVFQVFKESIDKRREYNLMSAWEEITAWQEFAKQYVEGTETRMKADKEVARLRWEYSKTWIDKEKYYKRLSLEDELKAWENVQARYAKGTEYRLQAEREIFRLKEEIWQAEYEHALEYVDDEKYYGRMNLSEELKEWKKIAKMTEENSDERKKADREIFRLENEIKEVNLSYEEKLKIIEQDRTDRRIKAEEDYYQKTKDIKEKLERDIKSITDAYESAVDSRAKTLYSTYGLFEEVEKPKYVSGFELINNLEDQNTAFDKWQSSIGALAAKGVDEGLIKELRDMGPKSLAEINALNRLSDTELSRYVDLWQKKSREAKDQATAEFADLKTANDATITQMTADANVLLQAYKEEWDETLVLINSDTKTQLTELETGWLASIGSMTKTGLDMLKQFKKDWFGELASMNTATNTSMAGMANITSVMKPAATAIGTAVNTALDGGGLRLNMNTTGKNIVAGLAAGITANTGLVTKATTDMNNTSVKNIDSFWMINSPSKRTMETGMYIVMGMAEGIKQFAGLVSKESTGVGETALAAMGSSMSSIPDLLGTDLESFTITPVLDLTNIRNGITDVNSLMGGVPGLDLSGTMKLLPKTNQTGQNGILSEIRNGLLSMTNPKVDLTGKMTVEIVDDKGNIVAMAVQEVIDLMRRESR